jgi:hypothetical protein
MERNGRNVTLAQPRNPDLDCMQFSGFSLRVVNQLSDEFVKKRDLLPEIADSRCEPVADARVSLREESPLSLPLPFALVPKLPAWEHTRRQALLGEQAV